jgi:ABC-type branched-subunit amino acid transport system permease subunit
MAGPFSKRELFFIALTALIGLIVLPCLNAFAPDGSLFHVTDLALNRYGKYLTYAVLALGVNLLWGYTGLLSLGQCLFFSLGGYAFGMYLMMNISRLGQYHEAMPDFMVFLEYQTKYAATGGFPAHWIPFKHLWFALAAMVLVPAVLAYGFGFLAFRSRIKGVYFSILSQALTYAACLMFFRNDFTFGGNNGLTDFKFMLGTPALEVGEIKDPTAFSAKLQKGEDGLSKYLWSQFAPTNQARLPELAASGKTEEVAQTVVDEINRTMATTLIYDEQRFAGVPLSEFAKGKIAENPRDADMLKLNRQLVEEAYPGVIAHKGFTGYVINDPSTKRGLYVASGILLLLTYLFCRWLTSTRFGLIQRAVRDSENRVLFSGYATADFKLFVFVIAAVIAALGGALSVPQIGGINPSEMSPEKSIEAVIWVSVGGRGNLLGPILGAVGINSLKSYATHNFAEQWPYILGGLFVFVTLFMPKGLIGLPGQLRGIAKKFSKQPEPPSTPAAPEPKPATSTKE